MLKFKAIRTIALFAFILSIPLTVSCSNGSGVDFDEDRTGNGDALSEQGANRKRNDGFLDAECDDGGVVNHLISDACWYVVPAGSDCSTFPDGGCYQRGEMHPDTITLAAKDADMCIQLLELVGEEFEANTAAIIPSVDSTETRGLGCAMSSDGSPYVDDSRTPREDASSPDHNRLCGCTR